MTRRLFARGGAVVFALFLLQQSFTYSGKVAARNLCSFLMLASGAGLLGYGYVRAKREARRFEEELAVSIREASTKITETARALTEVSGHVESAATRLAGTSQSQTSSVQETLQTMGGLSQAIESTSGQAKEGNELGKKGLEEGFKGLDIIDRMIGAVEQLRESHQSLQSLVTLIETIREKTRVINDIVFETRLLAFNASIEAARAGESGKGFAVVAEHVAKLANMSGQAALEINELLNSATKEVGEVVKVTRERVEVGAKVTIESQGAFEAVNSAIMKISSTLDRIGQSATEQQQSIKGAADSMKGINSLTRDHLESAKDLSSSANRLVQESMEFMASVEALKSLVAVEVESPVSVEEQRQPAAKESDASRAA